MIPPGALRLWKLAAVCANGSRFTGSLAIAGFFVLLYCQMNAVAEDEAPQLAIDTGFHQARVNKVLFTPDGSELISVSCDKTIRIWNAMTGEPVRTLWYPRELGDSGRIYAAALSANGEWLAVGAFGGYAGHHPILVISLRTNRVEQVLEGHATAATDLEFSSDYEWLASSCHDRDVKVWHVASGQCSYVLKGHQDDVYGLAWCPNDQRLLTGSFDKTACLWNVGDRSASTQREILTQPDVRFEGHGDKVVDVSWSPDGRHVATASHDHTIRIWETEGKLLRTVGSLDNANLTSMTFTANGEEILYTTGTAFPVFAGLVDAASGKRRLLSAYHFHSILDGTVSPDGQLAATCDAAGNIAVWKTRDGSLVWRCPGKMRWSHTPLWTRDGRAIRTGWIRRPPEDSSGTKTTQTGKSSQMHSRSGEAKTTVFDVTTLSFRSVPSHAGFVVDACYLESGKPVETAGGISLKVRDGNTVDVLKRGTLLTSIRTLHEHDQIRDMTVLDDAEVVLATMCGLFSFDAHTGELRRRYQGHFSEVESVARSPDGRHLVTSSADGTIRVWDVSQLRPVLSLYFSGSEWIAWSSNSDYACSPGARKWIGFCASNGPNELMTFAKVADTGDSRFRPDVIKTLVWKTSTEEVEQAKVQLRFGKLMLEKNPGRAARYLQRAIELAPDTPIGDEARRLMR